MNEKRQAKKCALITIDEVLEDDMVAFAKWLRVSGWQDYSDVLPDLFINDYDEKVSSKNLLELWKEQQMK